MPTLTVSFDYSSDEQRLALEQTIAYLNHLNHAADTAVSGTVLDTCEQLALTQGRDVLRATLQAALQTRARAADRAQKKSPARGPKATTPAVS